jgi:putative protease
MNKIELLAPVGDFECLKAAVQNGADAVYLGASTFSARASAKNFDLTELENAISYAHLRNVKVHLALNTLIKNDELDEAFLLAKEAYKMGVDALIVQDYGLCSLLLKYLPSLPIHASTQMSIHNLEGAQQIENLGFSRVVLARETSLDELEFIKNNTNIELEVFIHGALCISYSGQCLISSMIGGRSRKPWKMCTEVAVYLMS